MNNVPFAINFDLSTPIIVGAENKSLNVLPLLNSGFSFLNDMECELCTNKSYNSSGIWSVNGQSNSTSLFSEDIGNILGKSVKDSFCLSSQLEVCYSNLT
jgi:hypothetical protein